MLKYQLITSSSALKEVCERASACPYIALDTEFVRTRTYYPQLGLVQLYDGETLSLIDPLPISDWQPFVDLLRNPQVVKLLHAGSEDLEVFLHDFQTLPQPLIDTQILAAFTGRPLSSGFAAMVSAYQQVDLDKSESRTDWLARPLSERQCDYAAADVYYLLPMAHKLLAEVEACGWLPAALDECQALCRRRAETVEPALAYREMTNAWQLRPRQLACLQLLGEWRLNQARTRDMAVNFVVREESLWLVARYMPGSMAELSEIGVSGPEIRYHGKALLEIVERAAALEEAQLPPAVERLIDHPGYKQAFKHIKTLVQQVAEQRGLTAELLASRRQINQLLSVQWQLKTEQPELLSGWRGQLLADGLNGVLKK
ncbi:MULTISPECIES: ribonuclease D [Edwardsiella]|uniref:Ribonuclease D n=2 Tax=Edwardsiella anguillarum TaxID=1821960 RepID=A0A076LT74_9GAMM|nr:MULTISPECIES: ribonuclease D [Edwardsiella]AKM48054.1 ribonuclease D [Edwardsiella sp. EA181011]GAJ68363.1 ribonuclease D [Edwardsiella piscicida]AIJ09882.1 Ribonuclease D [Edwardsiella anguillarum ET080813]KAB0589304.1 ribonuclease D [Edwardsiella anguillarum]RFT03870.1 ribonuclease D [Edwardsiella anguillarum]